MCLYDSFYVLYKKSEEGYFLTEDKTYTKQLERVQKFPTYIEAQEMISFYNEQETDEYYDGDFFVHKEIEIKAVQVIIK